MPTFWQKGGLPVPRDPSVLKTLRHSNPYYFASAVVFYYLYRFLPLFLRKTSIYEHSLYHVAAAVPNLLPLLNSLSVVFLGWQGFLGVPEKGHFPLGKKGGGRRHKIVKTIWCMFDSLGPNLFITELSILTVKHEESLENAQNPVENQAQKWDFCSLAWRQLQQERISKNTH